MLLHRLGSYVALPYGEQTSVIVSLILLTLGGTTLSVATHATVFLEKWKGGSTVLRVIFAEELFPNALLKIKLQNFKTIRRWLRNQRQSYAESMIGCLL